IWSGRWTPAKTWPTCCKGYCSNMHDLLTVPRLPLAALNAASSGVGSSLVFLVATIVIALVFDFTNGFHDTATAVATSISTRVMPARLAIIMAAALNFLGAFVSTAVAKTIGTDLQQ